MIQANLQKNNQEDNVIVNRDQRETYNQILTVTQKKEDIKEENEEEMFTKTEWFIVIMIGISGFILQPAYLLFYIIYGLFEIYRRFNCFHFYNF